MMNTDSNSRTDLERFPIGASVRLVDLAADPYPIYARLRAAEPVSWIPELRMYLVTSESLVRKALLDDQRFTTSSPHSVIQDTFGINMLTSDGPLHDRYRRPFQPSFLARNIRVAMIPAIEAAVDRLFAKFGSEVELRSALASRLPVQTILIAFGLPVEDEPYLRNWYDAFERALSNFTGDAQIRASAHEAVRAFHRYLDHAIHRARTAEDNTTLLGALIWAPEGERLDDEAIKTNLSIVFFGGISTVEALILNTVWALAHHDDAREAVVADPALLTRAVDETMRWLSPVQSATRHVVSATELGGVRFEVGDTVNCMIAAANRDPVAYENPDQFNIFRANPANHLGFATGPHLCIGFRLAKAEAEIALSRLLAIAPNLRLVAAGTTAPEGHEFRQPRKLTVSIER